MPSIVDLAPAAGWDEREAHDLHGVDFAGHEPLRPLVDHDLRLDRWTVPVRGHDAYQVAVGPIHAGVIESGHFRLPRRRRAHPPPRRPPLLQAPRPRARSRRAHARRRTGLRDARLRGLRRRERRRVRARLRGRARPRADRRARPRAHDPARARAHVEPPQRPRRRLRRRRARCRKQSLCRRSPSAPAGSTPSSPATASSSARSASAAASSTLDRDDVRAARRRDGRAPARVARRGWRELRFNRSFQDRLPDIGVVDADAARQLGAVGPAARAAGLAEDVRATQPAARLRRLRAVMPERAAGDVQARVEQRALELEQTFALLERCSTADRPPRPRARGAPEQPIGIGRVESPRGATTCIVERSDDRIERLRLRTGLLCELAGRRVRRRRQPAPRLPAHQQELRALLRLRRPLMLTLLRDLRRLRRTSTSRHRDARRAWRSATSTPARATAASTSSRSSRARTTTSNASASASSPPRVTPTSCSSPAP